MKLPSFRRIFSKDYEEQYQSLIQTLSVTINYGLEALYDLMNNKITFVDNMDSTYKEFSVTVDSTGKPTSKTSFKIDGSNKPLGLMLIKADNLTDSSIYPTSGIFISYTQTTTDIIINNITGLPAGNLFSLRVLTIR